MKDFGHDDLPSDARTLLGTPRDINYIYDKQKEFSYAYLGLKEGIIDKLRSETDIPHTLKLRFNVDGLLVDDSNGQFWPILCSISNINDTFPFIVSLYEGKQKPDMNKLLNQFVNELIDLDGKIEINGIEHQIEIECFIADAPAKAAMLKVKGHAGYGSCTKCTIVGKDKNVHNKVVFPGADFPLRANESFRAREDKNHHHEEKSVLEKLQYLNMVDSFPLDYMHVVLLGVVRKIMRLSHEIFPPRMLREINFSLDLFKRYFPSEINRKSRSIFEGSRYKATES